MKLKVRRVGGTYDVRRCSKTTTAVQFSSVATVGSRGKDGHIPIYADSGHASRPPQYASSSAQADDPVPGHFHPKLRRILDAPLSRSMTTRREPDSRDNSPLYKNFTEQRIRLIVAGESRIGRLRSHDSVFEVKQSSAKIVSFYSYIWRDVFVTIYAFNHATVMLAKR